MSWTGETCSQMQTVPVSFAQRRRLQSRLSASRREKKKQAGRGLDSHVLLAWLENFCFELKLWEVGKVSCGSIM